MLHGLTRGTKGSAAVHAFLILFLCCCWWWLVWCYSSLLKDNSRLCWCCGAMLVFSRCLSLTVYRKTSTYFWVSYIVWENVQIIRRMVTYKGQIILVIPRQWRKPEFFVKFTFTFDANVDALVLRQVYVFTLYNKFL